MHGRPSQGCLVTAPKPAISPSGFRQSRIGLLRLTEEDVCSDILDLMKQNALPSLSINTRKIPRSFHLHISWKALASSRDTLALSALSPDKKINLSCSADTGPRAGAGYMMIHWKSNLEPLPSLGCTEKPSSSTGPPLGTVLISKEKRAGPQARSAGRA